MPTTRPPRRCCAGLAIRAAAAAAAASLARRRPRLAVASLMLAAALAALLSAALPPPLALDASLDTLEARGTPHAAALHAERLLTGRLGEHAGALSKSGRPVPPPAPPAPCDAPSTAVHVLLADESAPRGGRGALEPPALRAACRLVRAVGALPSYRRHCHAAEPAAAAGAWYNQSEGCAATRCEAPVSLLSLPEVVAEGVPELRDGARATVRAGEAALAAALRAGVAACEASRAAAGPAAPLQASSSACMLLTASGLPPNFGCDAVCAALTEVRPTAMEAYAVAQALAGGAADARGCALGEFDDTRAAQILVGASVLAGWTARSEAANALMPLGPRALLDHAAVAAAAMGSLTPPAGAAQRIVWRVRGQAGEIDALVADIVAEARAAVAAGESEGAQAGVPNARLVVRWREWGAFDREISHQLASDVSWAGGSLLLIAVYLRVHTRSWTLSVGALVLIVASLPLSLFVSRVLLRISWLSVIDGIGIFVTVGVACDDVFILCDHHRAACRKAPAAKHSLEAREARLASTVAASMGAVAVTSLTTACAFGAAAFSPIAATRLFGMKVAVSVLVNFLLVALVFPAALWLAEERGCFDEHCGDCCEAEADELLLADSAEEEQAPAALRAGTPPSSALSYPANVGAFLAGPWLRCVTASRFWLVAALIATIAGAAAGGAKYSGFRGPREPPALFPPGTNQADYLAAEELLDADTGRADLRIVWGVLPVDAGNRNTLEWRSPGPLHLDDSFQPSRESVQLFFREVCQELGGRRPPSEATRAILPLIRRGDLKCWAEDFEAWLAQRGNASVPLSGDGTNATNTTAFLPAALPVPEALFDAAAREWHLTGGNYGGGEAGLWFDPASGAVRAVVVFSALTTYWARPPEVLAPQRQTLQAWIDTTTAAAPEGARAAFQTAGGAWAWEDTQRALVRGAWGSLAISLAISFIVLAMATNLAVGFAAIACIAGAVAVFLVLLMLEGWSLGVMESICVTAAAGLSVDYVSHVAVLMANHDGLGSESGGDAATVSGRLRHALATVGPSVVGACVTSCGAAAFLLPATIVFFSKFGAFVVTTLLASLLAALAALPAVASCAPPALLFGKEVGAGRGDVAVRAMELAAI